MSDKSTFEGTVTLTFGDVAENHTGMQEIGEIADHGFTLEDLQTAQKYFRELGCDSEIVCLNDFLPSKVDESELEALEFARENEESKAYLLVIRGGLLALCEGDLLGEMVALDWDTKFFNDRRRVVQNLNARYNLCFSDTRQEADFEAGKGNIFPWDAVPLLASTREALGDAFGDAGKSLQCEGNMYYKHTGQGTGIGYHADAERNKVIGVRIGESMSLHFMWFNNFRPRGLNVSVKLYAGDVYCMSEFATGSELWKVKRNFFNLRHAAGAAKYTTKTDTIEIRNQRPLEDSTFTVGDIWFKRKKGAKDKVRSEPVMMPN